MRCQLRRCGPALILMRKPVGARLRPVQATKGWCRLQTPSWQARTARHRCVAQRNCRPVPSKKRPPQSLFWIALSLSYLLWWTAQYRFRQPRRVGVNSQKQALLAVGLAKLEPEEARPVGCFWASLAIGRSLSERIGALAKHYGQSTEYGNDEQYAHPTLPANGGKSKSVFSGTEPRLVHIGCLH